MREIAADPVALKRVELAVVAFGGTVRVVQDLATADKIADLSNLTASGGTPMGAAITVGLDLLERKSMQSGRNPADHRLMSLLRLGVSGRLQHHDLITLSLDPQADGVAEFQWC